MPELLKPLDFLLQKLEAFDSNRKEQIYIYIFRNQILESCWILLGLVLAQMLTGCSLSAVTMG